MTVTIEFDYGTDRSKSQVRQTLRNVAKRLNDAAGREIPTKTVFEEPKIVDEDRNHFSVPVRQSVTEAGFSPTQLLSDVHYHGMTITVLGANLDGDRDTLHVEVSDGDLNGNPDMDTLEEIWSNIN